MVCAACGYESQDAFKFCPECGAPAAAAPSAREQRKTVTVVFCDVTGSTALGEQLDPESLRHVMARYFETMRAAIERHGGTVEKFIGDAVMAVFGVPVLHEDDALRAVRAAAEMQAVLGDLNEELLRDYGTTLALRIGANTGEVVTGTEERLATGDAVNLAARLEQAAAPGEVLVGAQTAALVRGAVELVALPPIEVKGKSEPVTAHRLVQVNEDGTTRGRRFDRPMVGRERELSRLRDTFEQAMRDRSCQLFTVLGPAGIGKSRLVRAFLDGLDGARIVTGACLPYGDGITYWPVVEVVKQLLGEDPEPRLDELDVFSRAAVSGLLGEDVVGSTPDDTATAVRLLLEAEARRQPVVVVWDDIHWGERVFLDLIEHVADLARDAPLMLLCMARPELREVRTGWGGGLLNATTVLLEPLADADTDALIDRILADDVLGDAERAGILASAEGNPLFVEEMLAMREERGGRVAIPPSIQALLASRLDALPGDERAVLELGAIEGQLFHASAVQALAPAGMNVTASLTSAVRKDLIRPAAGLLPGAPAYRFRHLLIRDAAYDGLAKAARAELHARYADWLDEHGRDLVEYSELAGYHLEQAYRYRAGLGPVDDATRELGERAAEQLAEAGQAAYGRIDWDASVTLLRRAADLLPAGDPRRLAVLPRLGAALVNAGDVIAGAALLAETMAEARAAGDERAAALATVYRLDAMAFSDPAFSLTDATSTVAEIADRLEALGDDWGTAKALFSLARLHWWGGRGAEAETGFRRAVAFAERVGDLQLQSNIYGWWTGLELAGPPPVSEIVIFLDSIPAAVRDRNLTWTTQRTLASIAAMQGRFDEARAAIAAAAALLRGNSALTWTWQLQSMARIERYAGDLAAVERALREAYDRTGAAGAVSMQAGVGFELAEVLSLLGRGDEAAEIIDLAEASVPPSDASAQASRAVARAELALVRGDAEAAVRFGRAAVDVLAETDWLRQRADSQFLLARAMRASGDDGAADSAREARRLYALKEHTVGVGWADAFLAASLSGAA